MKKYLRLRYLSSAVAMACAVAGLSSAVLAPQATAATTNPAPLTLPSIHQWTSGTGSLTLTGASRIVVNAADNGALGADANTFAADLATLTGLSLPVVAGSAPNSGDIFLKLDTTTTQAEGYTAAIGTSVTIQGKSAGGVFHGEQTVEQILALDPSHTDLPVGTAVDWPTEAHRGIMIDMGRHFWSLSDLKAEIRQMSWQKLNVLHAHFTDFDAFRLQSTTYPGLAPATGSYSHADIADLVAYAAKYHITLLPEIDLPGHATPIVNFQPSLAWKCSSMGKDNLDITNPATTTFVTNLINEFVPLFPNSPVFHTGGDETPYLSSQRNCPDLVNYASANGYASTEDVYVAFANKLDQVVTGLGRTMEIWNWWDAVGGATISPNKDIIIDAWTSTPTTFTGQGYTVVANSREFYTTPGFANTLPDDATLYSSWAPSTDAGIIGYEVSLWGDSAQTQPTSYFDRYLRRPGQVLADRAWGGPRTATSNFTFEDAADAIGTAPGGPQFAPKGGTKLTGTSYGTSPAFNNSSNTYDKVFDGNVGTYFDYSQASGGYAGLDLGTAQRITKVRFTPRDNTQQSDGRMIGGVFQGCTTGPDTGCVTLATVPSRPTYDWTELPVTDTNSYRWVRYLSPTNGYANIAEAQFYGSNPTGRPIEAGRYTMADIGSGYYADMSASSLAPGGTMDQWTLNTTPNGTTNQQWNLTPNADGSYTIKNAKSGLCVDVTGGSTSAGALIDQWTCTGNTNQHWKVTPATTGGGYTITSVKSGLALAAPNTTKGSQLIQTTSSSSTLQNWTLTKIG